MKIVDVDLLSEGGYFTRGGFLVNVEGRYDFVFVLHMSAPLFLLYTIRLILSSKEQL